MAQVTLSTGGTVTVTALPDLGAWRRVLPAFAAISQAAESDHDSFLATLSGHIDAMAALVDASTGNPAGWADTLSLDDFFAVLAVTLHVNAASMAQQGLPRVLAAIQEP
jgi:hypothetical protein